MREIERNERENVRMIWGDHLITPLSLLVYHLISRIIFYFFFIPLSLSFLWDVTTTIVRGRIGVNPVPFLDPNRGWV